MKPTTISSSDNSTQNLLSIEQLQAALRAKDTELAIKTAELVYKEALIDKLTAQIAQLKRLQYGRKAESFSPEQRLLFEDTLAEDLACIETQLKAILPKVDEAVRQQPKRQPLPPQLPREVIHHEPDTCQCTECGGNLTFIRNEVSEQLEFIPARFIVKQHVRAQYSCRQCETVVSAAAPMQLIDKGIPGSGLLAQVAISKYADHLPLYRQQQIFARSGVNLSSSTLAGWMGAVGVALAPLVQTMQQALLTQPVLHVDETPVQMLDPGKGKTARAYIWVYRSQQDAAEQIAVYDFAASRAGIHASQILAGYQGAIMVDDYAGYKALFKGEPAQIQELGCWAHVRRKFYELFNANKSQQAQTALDLIQKLYQIEAQADNPEQKLLARQQQSKPIIAQFHIWLITLRSQIPGNTGLANAIDYTLKRWPALIRYLDNPLWPIDNNPAENSIRPIALGRKNWLFAGSLPAGQRAASIMSLIETAKLNGHDPWAYLNDVLAKLPTWPDKRIHELLPYHWSAD